MSVYLVKTPMSSLVRDIVAMSLKADAKGGDLAKLVAVNVSTLMQSKNPPLTQNAFARRSNGEIPQRTIGRIMNAEVNCTLSQLGAIAKVLGVQAWQLLVPDLDPAQMPSIQRLTPQQRETLRKLINLSDP